jgi:uncharacterized membrane protein YfcA
MAAIVGGAAVITFPALLAAGLPPVMATASNTVALTPGLFLAAMYDRSQLPPLDRSFIALVLASVTGALLEPRCCCLRPNGCSLRWCRFCSASRPCCSPMPAGSAHGLPRAPRAAVSAHSLAAVLPVSVYGGYFGAGVGVLMLGVFSVGTGGDYRSANVTKNLVTALNSATASVMFATARVSCTAALLMMIRNVARRSSRARLAQVMPNRVARALVVGVGALLTCAFAWRYWARTFAPARRGATIGLAGRAAGRAR